jgi:TolB-like protein/Flp pilus assembly protein TadD
VSFFAELRRRNVVRVGLLYGVAGWLVLQVADVLAGLLGLPDWTLRFVAFLFALGFPLVLIFSWVFELTPEGIKLERDVVRDSSITDRTGKKLNLAIGGLLVLAVALLLGQLALDRPENVGPGANSEEAAQTSASTPGLPSDESAVKREAAAPSTSIAVLPFTNMSSDPENEYFADGLSEELLNVLAQIEGFKVAGRTSSFSFKGKNQDLRQIGQTLNVGTVLEGSVRKSGDQVRITAQLVNVADGYHLWSATYDRKLDDIFSIQDDIARQVVDALKQTLLASQDEAILEKRPTDNVEAYQYYLRGRHQIAKRSRQGFELALEAFREAVKLDPDFARAWTGIADAQSLMASYGYEPIGKVKKDAERAIDIALSLDPELGEAYASRGLLLAQSGVPTEEIVAQYRKAIALNPNNSLAHMWLSGQLLVSDLEGASEHIRSAYALDPLSGIVVFNLAGMLVATGHIAEGRQHAEELLELDPGWPAAHRLLGQIADTEGDSYTAIRAYLDALALDSDDIASLLYLGNAFLALGDLEVAARYTQKARDKSPFFAQAAAVEALLLSARGEPEAGLQTMNELLARQPEDSTVLAAVILIETQMGSPKRALALCRQSWNAEVPPANPDQDALFSTLAPCAFALRTTGLTEQSRSLGESGIATFEHMGDSLDIWQRHFVAARIAAAAGEREAALREFRLAMQKGLSPTAVLPLDSWMLPYRDDPDFKPLFDRLFQKADEIYARLSAEGLTSGQRVAL